jgi:hypothetical protein
MTLIALIDADLKGCSSVEKSSPPLASISALARVIRIPLHPRSSALISVIRVTS